MNMHKEKLKSFIKLAKRDCVSEVCMVEEFNSFYESNFNDAYEFFANKGMIQTESISKIKIGSIISKWIRYHLSNKDSQNDIVSDDGKRNCIKYVMKYFGGNVDPNIVLEVFEEFTKE